MRSDKKDNKLKNSTKTKFGTFTKIWAVLFLAASVAFAVFLYYSDILPDKILYIGMGIIALIMIILLPGLFSRKFKKSRKVLCFILSLLVVAAYGAGTLYMTNTLGFFDNITEINEQTEDYYVVVRKDSGFKDIDEINGKTVATYASSDFTYSEARNELKEKEKVKYEMIESLDEIGNGLLNKTYDIIFVSAVQHETITGEHETFGDDTEILYKVKVKVPKKDISKDVDVTKQSFNVYISGLDVDGTIDATSRSDVNMIATVNPRTKTVLLTSLPRDTVINLPSKDNAVDKLTHTGIYGINETVASVEKLMGIDINYYVKVNYSTVTKFVDAIGGIDVNSDYTFTTSGMAASGLSGITFYEGMNHLDGMRALAFARERHSFQDGDVQRNRNQQKIMRAIIKKGTSSKTLLTKYSSILNSIGDYVELNMTSADIKNLVKMQLDDMARWKVRTQEVDGTIDSIQCYSTGDYYVSVMQPVKSSIISRVDRIVSVMQAEPEKEE